MEYHREFINAVIDVLDSTLYPCKVRSCKDIGKYHVRDIYDVRRALAMLRTGRVDARP